jgi:excisionase family DNA binding protein
VTTPPSPTDPTILLSLDDVARHLGVSRDTLHELRRHGQFTVPELKVGRQTRVRRVDVERWVAEQADLASLSVGRRRSR